MKYLIPIIILLGLFTLLWYELFYAKPNELPSALIGQKVPDFKLQDLSTTQQFTAADLQGKLALLNFWATWCEACKEEHSMLLKIHSQYHIPIYAILYKDKAKDARHYLDSHGNPFQMIGMDDTGDIGIDFGIYGTPETFVINPEGMIVYRFVGAIDQNAWDNVLYPIIKQYQTHKAQ